MFFLIPKNKCVKDLVYCQFHLFDYYTTFYVTERKYCMKTGDKFLFRLSQIALFHQGILALIM